MFFVALTIYILYLLVLIVKAYSDLRNMPYFGKYDNIIFFSIASNKNVKYNHVVKCSNSMRS